MSRASLTLLFAVVVASAVVLGCTADDTEDPIEKPAATEEPTPEADPEVVVAWAVTFCAAAEAYTSGFTAIQSDDDPTKLSLERRTSLEAAQSVKRIAVLNGVITQLGSIEPPAEAADYHDVNEQQFVDLRELLMEQQSRSTPDSHADFETRNAEVGILFVQYEERLREISLSNRALGALRSVTHCGFVTG